MTFPVHDRPLLTVAETASRLALSEKTVRRFVSAGILPAVRVSAGAIRVEADELHEWIEGRRTSSDVSESGTPRSQTPAERRETSEAAGQSSSRQPAGAER
jgi:excisionase family DNA binding protein